MIRRVILSPVAGLLLVITAILGVSYSSAHAQTQTRHLVFSTYLGPKTPPPGPAHTFAQNCASDAQGNTYVTGATDVSNLPVLRMPSNGAPRPTAPSRRSWRNTTPTANRSGAPTWVATIRAWASGWPPCRMAAWWSSASPLRTNFPHHERLPGDQYNGNSDYFVTVFDANGNHAHTRRTWAAAGWRDSQRTSQPPMPMTKTMATVWRWMRKVWSMLPA